MPAYYSMKIILFSFFWNFVQKTENQVAYIKQNKKNHCKMLPPRKIREKSLENGWWNHTMIRSFPKRKQTFCCFRSCTTVSFNIYNDIWDVEDELSVLLTRRKSFSTLNGKIILFRNKWSKISFPWTSYKRKKKVSFLLSGWYIRFLMKNTLRDG